MKKIIIILIILVIILVVIGIVLISSNAAKQIANPTGLTLEQEMKWEKEHSLWGNFDSYEKEEYKVKGYKDYELNVVLVKNPNAGNKYVILSHGYKSNRYGNVKYIDTYINLGFNCIIYDVRGHGNNEKAIVSLGQFESLDLEKIIEDTYKRYGDISLGLHGESMGSATSLSVLKYKPKVDFVVADCGFSNLYDLIDDLYKNQKFGFITPFVNMSMKLNYGYDMKNTSPKTILRDNEVPVCFIHGKNDSFVLPKHSVINSENDKGYSEVHLIENAEHAQSREVLGEKEYTDIVREFLKKVGK